MSSAQTSVRLEQEKDQLQTVIYGAGPAARELETLLKDLGLRVYRLNSSSQVLPVLERPHYIYFLLTADTLTKETMDGWGDAVNAAKRTKAKLILLSSGLSEAEEARMRLVAKKEGVAIWEVVLSGNVSLAEDSPTHFLQQAVQWSFSQTKPGRKVVFGREGGKTSNQKWQAFLKDQGLHSSEEIFSELARAHKVQQKKQPSTGTTVKRKLRQHGLGLLLLICFALVMAPFFLVAGLYTNGGWELWQARSALVGGKWNRSYDLALQAHLQFESGERFLSALWGVLPGDLPGEEGIVRIGNLGRATSLSVMKLSLLGKTTSNLLESVSFGSGKSLTREEVTQLHEEVRLANDQLGLLEALLPSAVPMGLGEIEPFKKQLGEGRGLLTKADRTLAVLPEILGLPSNRLGSRGVMVKKTYLVVFQNSAELRPTGGFIGSFALIHLENGILKDIAFHDVYEADGQLQGRVIPPDEVVHYLGQNSWYMRDANFAADFPLTAKRLEFFLEKELGIAVDGVVGMDLYAVENLLEATGPLTIADFNEQVTAGNFFEKAEFASEIKFFPGSTRKRDFLGAVGQTLLQKMTSQSGTNSLAIAQAIKKSLDEQHLLLFFNAKELQEMVDLNGWSGSVGRLGCSIRSNNCLMAVEANFGANKANYYLKRGYKIRTVIAEDGGVDTYVAVKYFNESPSLEWPGGNYKNYLRFLVPDGAEFQGWEMAGGKTASLSAVLNASALGAAGSSHFVVYQSKEDTAYSQVASSSAMTTFGALVQVPIKEEREVVFHYSLPAPRRLGDEFTYHFTMLKQSGTGADPLDIAIDYPSSWSQIEAGSGSTLVFPKRILYNTDLAVDRQLEIKFKTNK